MPARLDGRAYKSSVCPTHKSRLVQCKTCLRRACPKCMKFVRDRCPSCHERVFR